jgi:Immunity protein 31
MLNGTDASLHPNVRGGVGSAFNLSLQTVVCRRLCIGRSATRFEFYEKVRNTSSDLELAEVNRQLAAVPDKSVEDDGTLVRYAVHIYTTGECWSVKKRDLVATGEFDRRETFHSGASIRVNEDGNVVGRHARRPQGDVGRRACDGGAWASSPCT